MTTLCDNRPTIARSTTSSFATASLIALLALSSSPSGCAKVQQVSGGTGGAGGRTGIPLPGITGLVSLTISPDPDMVVLTADATGRVVPATRMFTAEGTFDDQTKGDVTDRVNWSLAPRTGNVMRGTVNVNAPGIYRITATSGSISDMAELTATFKGERMGAGFVAGNVPKLDAAPTGMVAVAYPQNGSIFPSNFGAVTFQLPRTGGQDIARLKFVGDGLDLTYYGICETTPIAGGGCYVTVPSEVTKWFVGASSQRDITLTARLGSSAGGALAESTAVKLAWADVPLSGGLYYWTTINPNTVSGYTAWDTTDMRGTAVNRYNFNGDEPLVEMVWTDRGSPRTAPPFQESPPALEGVDPESRRMWGAGRCIGCHAISPDGQKMAFSVGGSDASSWAILNIGTTTLNDLDPLPLPPNTMGIELLKRQRRGNFAAFTTFSPGSDLMVNMYRGKLTMRQTAVPLLSVVRDDLFAAATPERKSDPFWSPDGKYFAFTTYDLNQETQNWKFNGDTKTGGQIWIANADHTGPRDDARVLVPRAPGITSYYPAISHDSRLLVFNKSQCAGPLNPGGYGTGPCDGYDDITAELWLTDPSGGTPRPMTLANGGPQSSNSWPRWSPDSGGFRGQQLYWLAFSSRRPYGLQVNSGAGTEAKPQLWFTAVLIGNEFSQDPGGAAVWLPQQNLNIERPTGNHVPQWVKFVVPIQ